MCALADEKTLNLVKYTLYLYIYIYTLIHYNFPIILRLEREADLITRTEKQIGLGGGDLNLHDKHYLWSLPAYIEKGRGSKNNQS